MELLINFHDTGFSLGPSVSDMVSVEEAKTHTVIYCTAVASVYCLVKGSRERSVNSAILRALENSTVPFQKRWHINDNCSATGIWQERLAGIWQERSHSLQSERSKPKFGKVTFFDT